MATKIVPVILCGGAGARLWPASRESRPKQFIALVGERSSFQEAVLRVQDPELFAKPLIVANADHRFLVAEQLEALGVAADVLLEPARRDSGPAIAAAAHLVHSRDPHAVLLTLAADHLVERPDLFRAACETALPAAMAGRIVVFGVEPSSPATGYGYIRPETDEGPGGLNPVAEFVEKPDAETAARYVADGYMWNSGNFLFSASAMLEDYAEFEPDSAAAVEEAVRGIEGDLGFLLLAREPFLAVVPKSIDYSVMERSARVSVVPVDCGWSDIGTWGAIWDASQKDARGNVTRGTVELVGSENCIAISDRPVLALAGMKDLVVVVDDDAVMVANRGDADGVKSIVGHLRDRKYAQASAHARGYRPWGFYQSLDSGGRFQVKRIVVKPGGTLSLQKHYHRAEHWVVVRGTAEVTIGDERKIISENESTYIPQGAMHRLRNPGKIDLEVIEVQTGSYLGEDDIERFEDIYGR
ncbi:mannose-1-phosphate guanylyltransferase/mannose-6-phosphate isomerase [Terrihabitans rhizophilus]|uniref:mannose-1-phosphate guanylyltransferase n=1 Tax=Terrihabitans rhizophilus TaxID=3092662 RepID=A0ABU4RQZ9_9HYPH|nr:mannose-1-phosphate guanylyltransferase/mannose-6-phosphate isomerase [Terrihabitans sp. PJ23]MDX6807282.1 mannose-1-phosphate guanylyltransferase/mannose-6-phosphate isomerase [Terrihabitans sp. PJ23]